MKENVTSDTSSTIKKTFLEETIAENKLPIKVEGKLTDSTIFRS